MRKILLMTIVMTASMCCHTQIFTGLNTTIELPAEKNSEINAGVGLGFSLGYCINKKIEMSAFIGNTWMSAFILGYRINSFELKSNYIILNKTVSPFIGLVCGYYKKSFDGPFEDRYSEEGFGIKPQVGLKFEIMPGSRLNAVTTFYYNKIFSKNQVSIMGFGFGLQYHFGKII